MILIGNKAGSISRLPALILFGLSLIPLSFITIQWFSFSYNEILEIFKEYKVGYLFANTLKLLFFVIIFTLVFGVSSAWIFSRYKVPFEKFFSVALMLPIAIPTYIFAFTYSGLFESSGIFKLLLSDLLGFNIWFDGFRTTIGTGFLMALSFSPYVFIIVRNAFESIGKSVYELEKIYGLSKFKSFFSLILPMSSPWIIGSLLLVSMETLADFGAVSILGYDTFTVAIYKAWYGFFKPDQALFLSGFLVLFSFILIILEKFYSRRKRYYTTGRSEISIEKLKLNGYKKVFIILYFVILVVVSFLIPILQLIYWLIISYNPGIFIEQLPYLKNTLLLSLLGTLIVVLFAFALSYFHRKNRNILAIIIVLVATAGYALPGSVLAVGFYVPITKGINSLLNFFNLDVTFGDIFTITGIGIMLSGYLIRYISVGYNTMYGNFLRIKESVYEQSDLLKLNRFIKVKNIFYPYISKAMFSAFILASLDISKEMPITLMTRPFGWDTLAVRIYGLTSEGEYERAAISALILILVGIIPILYIIYLQKKGEECN